jgi:hypothetical protein
VGLSDYAGDWQSSGIEEITQPAAIKKEQNFKG